MSDGRGEWLAVCEVAGELGVHANTVRSYIRKMLLPVTWQGGYRISREDLEQFKRATARRKLRTGRIG